MFRIFDIYSLMRIVKYIIILSVLFSFSLSCKKTENVTVRDNDAPDYSGIPTIHIENYINRLFIDLLGRESTNSEREILTERLKAANLDVNTRDSIVFELQFDTTYRDGDSSYRHAYCQRVYDLMKFRFLEGAADPEIGQKLGNLNFAIKVARLNGDTIRVHQYEYEKSKYENVLKSKYFYRIDSISYNDMCGYMMNNGIYDLINMGSFNFVNAAFDDVLGRNPTQDEFTAAYDVIDKNEPTVVFNKVASNKNEFINILVYCDAFYEAQVRWWYYQYVRREIPPSSLYTWMNQYRNVQRLEYVQRQILITDEYAQF